MYDPYIWQGQQLNRVNSVDDVLNAQIPRGSSVAFFHNADDVFFVKVTDERGNCESVRAFRFHEIDIDELRPVTMTRAEYNELKEMLENAKLIIQQQQQARLAVQSAQPAAEPHCKGAKPDADPGNA